MRALLLSVLCAAGCGFVPAAKPEAKEPPKTMEKLIAEHAKAVTVLTDLEVAYDSCVRSGPWNTVSIDDKKQAELLPKIKLQKKWVEALEADIIAMQRARSGRK
jgi:hypothetical protein